jgi:uncharacterized membrane protein YidH (DUF202 family)
MAWIRTSLAMISFGFTIGKLGDALASAKVNLMFGRTTDIAGVASYLVVIGTLALILALVQCPSLTWEALIAIVRATCRAWPSSSPSSSQPPSVYSSSPISSPACEVLP